MNSLSSSKNTTTSNIYFVLLVQLIEHPQNIFYGRMLRANIVLTEFSRGKKGEDGSIQKLDITMATRLWLNLQNEVCALLDSTTGTCFAFPHIDPVIGEMFMIWLACGHDNCCAMISSVCWCLSGWCLLFWYQQPVWAKIKEVAEYDSYLRRKKGCSAWTWWASGWIMHVVLSFLLIPISLWMRSGFHHTLQHG